MLLYSINLSLANISNIYINYLIIFTNLGVIYSYISRFIVKLFYYKSSLGLYSKLGYNLII